MNMFVIYVKPNFLTKYHRCPYGREQPKPNISEGDVVFIFIFEIPCLLISFVFLQPSSDVHNILSRIY